MNVRLSVAVMAHRKREAFIPELLSTLDRDATVVWDECNDRWHTGRRSMLAYDPQATHHLVVQDDAIICRDLVAGIERALGNVPEKTPLCLYVGRYRPYRDLIRQLVARATRQTSWLTMSQLHWGVGIVMPTELIDEMITWADDRPEIANYDRRISCWLGHQNITTWYPWPSLVDHRDSPSLVAGRGSAGRRAHRFVGADASALDLRWDGRVVTIPALNIPEVSAPGQIGALPVKFVSLKYPNLAVPAINVRFRPVQYQEGQVGVADVTTRGAIAHLQSPWMRRRGVRAAAEIDLTPAVADEPTEAPVDPPADPADDPPAADTAEAVDHEPQPSPAADAFDIPAPADRPAPPPTSGPGSGTPAWRAYAAAYTGTPLEEWEGMSRTDIQDRLRTDNLLPAESVEG